MIRRATGAARSLLLWIVGVVQDKGQSTLSLGRVLLIGFAWLAFEILRNGTDIAPGHQMILGALLTYVLASTRGQGWATARRFEPRAAPVRDRYDLDEAPRP